MAGFIDKKLRFFKDFLQLIPICIIMRPVWKGVFYIWCYELPVVLYTVNLPDDIVAFFKVAKYFVQPLKACTCSRCHKLTSRFNSLSGTHTFRNRLCELSRSLSCTACRIYLTNRSGNSRRRHDRLPPDLYTGTSASL